MDRPTLKQMYYFCKARYYTDGNILCQIFEDYEEEQIAEFIDGDMLSLADFLGFTFRHTDYLAMKEEINA